EHVTCRLDLADRPVEAEAVITRADLSGRAGIEFVSMSEADRTELKEWLFINALTGGVRKIEETEPAAGKASFVAPVPRADAAANTPVEAHINHKLESEMGAISEVHPAPDFQDDVLAFLPDVLEDIQENVPLDIHSADVQRTDVQVEESPN